MFMKNNVGKDAVWEAQQRGNEDLVGWMLGFGEEQIVGQSTEEDVVDAEEEPTENWKMNENFNEEGSTREP
jgi:hypothetical protein